MGSQRVPEILDSIFCSHRFSVKKPFVHFCISDKSVLQCRSSFLCFKHCKWTLIHSKVVECLSSHFLLSMDLSTLRDMLQPKIRPLYLCFLVGSHQDLPRCYSSSALLRYSSNTHSRGTLSTTRSSSLILSNTILLRYHCVDVDMFFLCRSYVTKYSRHWTRTHKTVLILSLLFGSSLTKGREDDDYKGSLNELPFFPSAHHAIQMT